MFSYGPFYRRRYKAVAEFMGWRDYIAESNEVLSREPERISAVFMSVQNGGRLAIGGLFNAVYNPGWHWGLERGGSLLRVTRAEGSRLFVRDEFCGPAPPLSWTTCFLPYTWPFLMIPMLPPGLSINIRTTRLEGWIDIATGEVDFVFNSAFSASLAGGLIKWEPPPLAVDAKMGTAEQTGSVFHAAGERLNGADATLVALSVVPRTDNKWQNLLMGLPTDALSVLKVRMEFLGTRPKHD
ncbi:hypothetical protein Vafri_15892 [Volvox africanus]|uniref:Uncharacterized protein n=1 Tax=Volvox africanus TaxID=51714 RepID=A0A8J4BM27_9CHLO|nr:hypothetical protein Vafri_15892 [Volvox africanus]